MFATQFESVNNAEYTRLLYEKSQLVYDLQRMLAGYQTEVATLRSNMETGTFWLAESQAKVADLTHQIEQMSAWMRSAYAEFTGLEAQFKSQEAGMQTEITRLNTALCTLLQENELYGGSFARDFLGVFRAPVDGKPAITMINPKRALLEAPEKPEPECWRRGIKPEPVIKNWDSTRGIATCYSPHTEEFTVSLFDDVSPVLLLSEEELEELASQLQ